MADQARQRQKEKMDKISNCTTDFKTASLEYDGTSNVPSNGITKNDRNFEEAPVVDNSNSKNGFIKTIKYGNISELDRADSTETKEKGLKKSSVNANNNKRQIEFNNQHPKKQNTGESALKYMGQKGLRSTEINKRDQYKEQQNPFKLKSKGPHQTKGMAGQNKGIQSKVKVIVPDESPQSRASKSKMQQIQASNTSKDLLNDYDRNLSLNRNRQVRDKMRPQSQSLSSGSFDGFKVPDQNSGDEESVVFQDKFSFYKSKAGVSRLKPQASLIQNPNMMALQRILDASNIYRDYLQKKGTKNKRPSIFDTEFETYEKLVLPQQFYFKPQRVFFKMKEDVTFENNNNNMNLICKMNQTRTKLFFQDLKFDQLKNMKGLKCNQINLLPQLKMAPNVQYDHQRQRFYIFSNKSNEIFVVSQVKRQILCRLLVTKKVNDPHLFLHNINNRTFLLLIGGYTKTQKTIVQGSKYIQIFQLKKWDIQIKSRMVRMSEGRISPIVTHWNQKNQSKILILGGNTIASIDSNNSISYDHQQQINQSTNQTATSISSQEILELFDFGEKLFLATHPVKINDATKLHDGCVVPVYNTSLILLPKYKYLVQIKFLNREINLIEGLSFPFIPSMRKIQRKEVFIQLKEQNITIYKINEKGMFQVISQDDKKAESCFCAIF